jgi:hypothetical protein
MERKINLDPNGSNGSKFTSANRISSRNTTEKNTAPKIYNYNEVLTLFLLDAQDILKNKALNSNQRIQNVNTLISNIEEILERYKVKLPPKKSQETFFAAIIAELVKEASNPNFDPNTKFNFYHNVPISANMDSSDCVIS